MKCKKREHAFFTLFIVLLFLFLNLSKNSSIASHRVKDMYANTIAMTAGNIEFGGIVVTSLGR
jgi:hypothetical protein